MDIFSSSVRHVKQKGLTLVELLTVIGMISVLIVVLIGVFNPFAQMQKAHNATRQEDLTHIKQALDAYMNDTGCYPTSLPFGSKWAVGSVTYMAKVPQDPDCTNATPTNCYDYQTDGTTCPQWNILYATMHAPISTGIPACILSTMSGCLPTGGIFTYNYCTVSGKLDCSYLSQNPLPTPSGSGQQSPGSTPTPTAVPTISICNGPLSACSNGVCDVESASQCLGCGGSMNCYPNLSCSNVKCN